jgi:hypothetical protein
MFHGKNMGKPMVSWFPVASGQIRSAQVRSVTDSWLRDFFNAGTLWYEKISYIHIYTIYIYYMYILICMVIHSAGRELPTVWNPYAHAQCAEDAPKTVNHLLGGAASSHVKDGANLKGVSWQQLRSPKSTLVTIVVTTDILGYRGYRGTHSVCVCLNRLNIAILYRQCCFTQWKTAAWSSQNISGTEITSLKKSLGIKLTIIRMSQYVTIHNV